MGRRKTLRKLRSKASKKIKNIKRNLRSKNIKRNLRKSIKSFKQLTLKQKLITSGMGVASIGGIVLPVPGASIPVGLATKKYVKKSLRRNKEKKRKKKSKKRKSNL